MNRIEFGEFENRTGLPAVAEMSQLSNMGARHFTGTPFEDRGSTKRVEQMQYQSGSGDLYVWKRIGKVEEIERMPFEIHFEICGKNCRYFPTKEVA